VSVLLVSDGAFAFCGGIMESVFGKGSSLPSGLTNSNRPIGIPESGIVEGTGEAGWTVGVLKPIPIEPSETPPSVGIDGGCVGKTGEFDEFIATAGIGLLCGNGVVPFLGSEYVSVLPVETGVEADQTVAPGAVLAASGVAF